VVAVTVVDRFEMIDIDHHHSQRTALTLAVSDFRPGEIDQCASIRQARQCIGQRELLELRIEKS